MELANERGGAAACLDRPDSPAGSADLDLGMEARESLQLLWGRVVGMVVQHADRGRRGLDEQALDCRRQQV